MAWISAPILIIITFFIWKKSIVKSTKFSLLTKAAAGGEQTNALYHRDSLARAFEVVAPPDESPCSHAGRLLGTDSSLPACSGAAAKRKSQWAEVRQVGLDQRDDKSNNREEEIKSETKKITLLDSVETEEKSSGEKEESSTSDERGEKKVKGRHCFISAACYALSWFLITWSQFQ